MVEEKYHYYQDGPVYRIANVNGDVFDFPFVEALPRVEAIVKALNEAYAAGRVTGINLLTNELSTPKGNMD